MSRRQRLSITQAYWWITHHSLLITHHYLSYQRKLEFLVFFVGIGAAVGGRSIGFGFLLFPDSDLFEKGVDHFAFFDVADDFTAFKDDPFAVARGDAEVGFARFAGTVDDAAQNADFHRGFTVAQ